MMRQGEKHGARDVLSRGVELSVLSVCHHVGRLPRDLVTLHEVLEKKIDKTKWHALHGLQWTP